MTKIFLICIKMQNILSRNRITLPFPGTQIDGCTYTWITFLQKIQAHRLFHRYIGEALN